MSDGLTLFCRNGEWEEYNDSPLIRMEVKNIEVISNDSDKTIFMATKVNGVYYKIFMTDIYIDIVGNTIMRLPVPSRTASYFIELCELKYLKRIFFAMRYLISLIDENDGVFDDEMITALIPAQKT